MKSRLDTAVSKDLDREGKIEQRIQISARKRPRGPGLSKQQGPALTSSIESYDKHLKPPQKRRNRPNGQQKSDKMISFI